ncbi:DUF58 domain-containing protein [Neobittarella massiliensis]|uniref:DUF58 domain-containing protein n=1 Tax=Neobittarella massiliensis (ex Bilen et al. 2018) TaxID=2041842 RepID=A0A8J6M167_9FIRM|nr:DUF58 domain-containing protein [Neobittarella massiliensis]MBC3515911.1 DUF58 domain-containing protein [Neobittarella massiliensis]
MRKSRILYGIVCLGALVFAGVYWDYLSFLIFVSCLLLPLFLYLQLRLTAKKVAVELQVSPPALPKKDPLQLTFAVHNRSFIPVAQLRIDYQLRNVLYPQVTGHRVYLLAPGKNTQRVTVNMRPQHMGTHQITVQRVLLYDFLRLFCVAVPCKNDSCTVAVQPRFLNSSLQLSDQHYYRADESELFSPTRVGSDPSEILRLRPYQPGDRLSRIHWKLSAKEGELVVKDPSQPIHSETYILLELYAPWGRQKADIDGVVESACMLSMLFLKEGVPHTVFWYDRPQKALLHQPVADMADLYLLVEKLLGSSPYGDDVQALRAYRDQFAAVFAPCGRVLYVTSRLQQRDIDRLGAPHRRKMTAFLVGDFSRQSIPDLGRDELPLHFVDSQDPAAAFNEMIL